MKAGISLSMTLFSSDYYAVTTDTLSMIRLSLVKSINQYLIYWFNVIYINMV
ncbi:hypothetical protein AAHH67_01390 [Niallia circulans]